MARAASGSIRWDKKALARAAGEGAEPLIARAVSNATNTANAMSSGFRTGIWHDHATGETKGNTAPVYEGDTQKRGTYPVGMVWTGNYSAAKENMEHNTLLKAVPHV